jgi:hypothetical protein
MLRDMRRSLALLAILATLTPCSSWARTCQGPEFRYESLALSLESVTVDGVPVDDLTPWNLAAYRIDANGPTLVGVTQDRTRWLGPFHRAR